MSSKHAAWNGEPLTGDVLLSVRNVSKKFCRNLRRSLAHGIKALSCDLFGIRQDTSRLRRDEFWALRDISFDLKRGETLGLVGLNGSGKTTLLRILNGIYPPDVGTVAVRGKVGGLIALGAGFHPQMTGRENIYVNGTLLGMKRREIDAHIERIIEFADIGEFIDAPVSTYSSGMHVRLGFSIATASEPEILLLDEILAVGDAAFRNKCYNRIGTMQRRAAVVLVSHSTDLLAKACTRGILLSQGAIACQGTIAQVLEQYLSTAYAEDAGEGAFESIGTPVATASVELEKTALSFGETTTLRIRVFAEREEEDCYARVLFYDKESLIVAEWNSRRLNKRISLARGDNVIQIVLGPLYLRPGAYTLGINLHERTGVYALLWSYRKHSVRVQGSVHGYAAYQLP